MNSPAARALLLLAALSTGCGTEVTHLPGVESQITLRIHTPPFQDSFREVATLRLILQVPGSDPVQTELSPAANEFELEASPGEGLIVRLEGLGPDGQVLLASGQSAPFSLGPDQPAQVDVLFARVGEFTPLLGTLSHPRFGHSASVLSDGRVLIFGGAAAGDWQAPEELVPPELYDPWLQQVCGSVDFPCPAFPESDLRFGHSASVGSAGGVLLFGGQDADGALIGSVLVFDPRKGEFRELHNFDPARVLPRTRHAATEFMFDDGSGGGARETVLLCGGVTEEEGRRVFSDNALIFDLVAENFTRTDLKLGRARAGHLAAPFGVARDRLLVVGGEGPEGLVAPAEVFSEGAFGAVVPTGTGARDGLARPRLHHLLVPLREGLLVVGGDDGMVSLDSPELFSPGGESGQGLFSLSVRTVGPGHSTRRGPAGIGLASGAALLAGGEQTDGFDRQVLQSTEAILAQPPQADFSDASPLPEALSFPAVAVLPGGGVLLVGGFGIKSGEPVAQGQIWYYNPG